MTTTNELTRSARIFRELMRAELILLNSLADYYNQEFSVDIDSDGYLSLIRCKYSMNNSFPQIEVVDQLCRGDAPLYMIAIPFEFALDRARQSLMRGK